MNKQGPNGIGWCDWTWNPCSGCLGPGGTPEKPNRCAYCYAEKVARRFTHDRNKVTEAPDPFAPTFHPDRLSQPITVKRPSKIFVCSMADLFGDWVPDEWIWEVLNFADFSSWQISIKMIMAHVSDECPICKKKAAESDPTPERPLSSEETAGFAVGDPLKEHGLPEDFTKVIADGLARPDRHENAAGKALCGRCGYKAVGRAWRCTLLIDQSSAGKCRGKYFYSCPAPNGDCPGFSQKPLRKKGTQGGKKKSLPVPAGVKFLYIGAPKGKTKKGVLQHQGVVTVAWIESSPGLLCVAFSFCSPADPWYKATGRDMAIRRLNEHSLVIPFLYDAKRTVHEVTRAVLSHDFKRLEVVAKTRVILIKGPSWTRNLAKRMETKRVSGLSRLFPFPIPIPLTIIAHMMADIDKLGR